MTTDNLGPLKACGSCRAPIRWALTRNGKAMPVNADPVEGGNVVLERRMAALMAYVVDATDPRQPRYTSHHVTCPNASAHRSSAKRAAA